ncbi:Mitotic spindle checkpoint component mad2 [Ceratobasidium sp. 414]|nr:Mitotic spindle checkpoint component mad2 [Ceratobasidium sp. 414]
MSNVQAPQNFTASGSPATIIEFLYYAVNRQENLGYPNAAESNPGSKQKAFCFIVTKYEQDLVITRDGEVTKFLDGFFKQVEVARKSRFLEWLGQNLIHRVMLVIVSKDTGKTLERWVFNLEPHTGPAHLDKVQLKIQSSLKQLKATIPIFPDINEPTVFNLLAVAKDGPSHPLDGAAEKWTDANPHAIPANVREQTALRGFNTSDTKLDMNVVYVDQ